ncbi:MAG: ParB/RepB/Spo0J family partition protein, partial [Flavobacteriales bacterium]
HNKMSTSKECKHCFRPVHAKNLCNIHYQRSKRSNKEYSQKASHLEKLMTCDCCLSGCENRRFQHNLCYKHFHEVMEIGRPKWLPGETKEYDPKEETTSFCYIKNCPNTPEEGKICEKHIKELEEIRYNKDVFNKDIEQKIQAFDTKEVSLDEVDFEDETFKMRQYFDERFIQDLARSIREHGLFHPPVYVKVPNRKKKTYRIVSGFCRTAAHRFLAISQPSFNKVEARIIKPESFSHTELLKLAFDENDKRYYISFLELALKAVQLRDQQAYKNHEIAEILDRKTSFINRLFPIVNKAHDDVLTALEDEKITAKHAGHIIGMDKEDQKYWLDKAIEEDMSALELKWAIKKKKSNQLSQSVDEFTKNPPKEIEFIGSIEQGDYQFKVDFKNRPLLEKFYKEFVAKYF